MTVLFATHIHAMKLAEKNTDTTFRKYFISQSVETDLNPHHSLLIDVSVH